RRSERCSGNRSRDRKAGLARAGRERTAARRGGRGSGEGEVGGDGQSMTEEGHGMTGLTERGEIEGGRSFRDALARLKRRRERLRGQLAEIEAELRDLGAIEAALALTIDALGRPGSQK